MRARRHRSRSVAARSTAARTACGFTATGWLLSSLFSRYQEKEKNADRQSRDAHREPESAPRNSATNYWPDNKLSGRAARHAKHLRDANQGGSFRGGKVFGSDVNCTDERKDTTGALHESSRARGFSISGREQ